jgi:hypothetical protein
MSFLPKRRAVLFCLTVILLIGTTLTSGCVDEVLNEIFGEPAPDPMYGSASPYSTQSSSGGYGWITICSYPGRAHVTIDGSYIGTTGDYEDFVVEVPSGSHRVEVTKPGYRGYQQYVMVYVGEVVYVDAFLTEGQALPTTYPTAYPTVYYTPTPADWGSTGYGDYECEAYERPQGVY